MPWPRPWPDRHPRRLPMIGYWRPHFSGSRSTPSLGESHAGHGVMLVHADEHLAQQSPAPFLALLNSCANLRRKVILAAGSTGEAEPATPTVGSLHGVIVVPCRWITQAALPGPGDPTGRAPGPAGTTAGWPPRARACTATLAPHRHQPPASAAPFPGFPKPCPLRRETAPARARAARLPARPLRRHQPVSTSPDASRTRDEPSADTRKPIGRADAGRRRAGLFQFAS